MKKKKLQTTDWYRLDRILNYPSSYYMIIGERSNGKTYSVKERIMNLVKNGGKFIYMRRVHRYITRRRMRKVFDDINDRIEKEIGSPFYYSTEKGFYITNDSEKGFEQVGYITSIEDFMEEKGIPFPEIKLILFDEFLDTDYMKEEIPMFLNMMSTIIRDRTDVEVFMLGNTITKYCPYFDLMGINPRELKQGMIHQFKHNLGAVVTVEYCRNKVKELGKEKKHKYIGFDDNESVKMIMYGDWEYKETNIRNVDGIGWNSMRKRVPLYITALNKVYEISLNLKDGKMPIAFIRDVNTQDGKVNEHIKYNLSYDKSVSLCNKNGIVPFIGKLTTLMDEKTFEYMNIVDKCIDCGRVVFNKFETGTEFLVAYDKVR